MELQSISQISKQFNISTRTLRYYEQIGLIKPANIAGLAYRTYDEVTVLRLKQIIVLRKLRIPLKQIAGILDSGNTTVAIELFQRNLDEIEDEITALSAIKNIIKLFVAQLNIQNEELKLLDDESLLEIVDSLTISKIKFKEEKVTMADLNRADEKLTKLTQRDVRIVYLPPATMASAHYIGEDSEGNSYKMLKKFIADSELIKSKPDVRCFGFNNPIQETGGVSSTGYEIWVTIPDDMEVSAPIRKVQFHGGLYAAHCIHNFEFEHWGLLHEWVNQHELYENDWGAIRCTPHMENQEWAFEETLNFYNRFLNQDPGGHQLELLFPIRAK